MKKQPINRRDFLSKTFKLGTAAALGTLLVGTTSCGEDSVFGSKSAYSIDTSKCDGCGDCLPYCNFGAITVSGGSASISSSRCVGCSKCVGACDNRAISR